MKTLLALMSMATVACAMVVLSQQFSDGNLNTGSAEFNQDVETNVLTNDRNQIAPTANLPPREPEWGSMENGLCCRIIAVSPANIELSVELKNVSDHTLTLIGVQRNPKSQAKSARRLEPEFFGPHLFEFEFMDAAGRPIPRPQRAFFSAEYVLMDAIAERVLPGKSLVVKLRPRDFHPPMDHRLEPGTYRAVVHYRGPVSETLAYFRQCIADQPHANAWSGDAKSNEVTFTVPENPNKRQRAELVWGEEQNGLQAAVEFMAFPGSEEAKFPEGTLPRKPNVATMLHVKNVSDRTITFVSETGRHGDECIATDEAGVETRLEGVYNPGWPIIVRWALKPGETAELHVVTSWIATIRKLGKYTLRYGINLSGRINNDGEGENDYRQVLYTGNTPITIVRRP